MRKKVKVFYLVLIILMLNSCKKENFSEHYEDSINSENFKIERYSFNQIQSDDKFFDLLSKFNIDNPKKTKSGVYVFKIKQLQNYYSKSSIEDLDIPIDMSKVVKITNEDYTSYTMRVIKHPEDTSKVFYNVVFQQKNEVENISFIKYTPSENSINNQTQEFDGQIELSDGSCLHEMMIGGSNPCDGNTGEDDGGGYGDDYQEICYTISTYIRTPCGSGHYYGCQGSPTPPTWPGGYWVEEEECHWVYVGYGQGSDNNGSDIATGDMYPNPNSPITTPTIGNIITSPITITDDSISLIKSHMSNLTVAQSEWLDNALPNIQDIILNYLLENNYDAISQEVITDGMNAEINSENSFINEFRLKKEYAKITQLFEFSPTYKQSLIDLGSDISNSTEEKGIYLLKNNNLPQFISANGEDNVDFPLAPPSPYVSQAHLHDAVGAFGDGTFSIFTFADLLFPTSLAKRFKIKTSKFVSFLITAKGTRYAFTINSASKFRNSLYNVALDLPNGEKIDQDRFNKVKKISNFYYTGENAIITRTNEDNDQVLIAFLQMLKENDMGITFYQVSEDFETYTQLTLDTDNTTIIYTPLN